MRPTTKDIGEMIKTARKNMGVTQRALAMTSGTGLRFIIELEKGKPTCQFGKVLTVINTLGISMDLTLPPTNKPAKRTGKEGA
jgi:HTH-type transcriptional regulator / antitoxin HipB